VGHAARRGYLRVVYGRYGKAEGKSKERMLDEFCLNTGYHRKYAIRLLNGAPPGKGEGVRARGRKPQYSAGVVSLRAAIWEAAGYPWSMPLDPPRPAPTRPGPAGTSFTSTNFASGARTSPCPPSASRSRFFQA